MSPGRLLVVDDNPENLKLLRFLLLRAGHEVTTAVDGPGALALALSTRPELVLLDIQLPGLDGLELARRLRADPATRAAVLVAVTAYAMRGDDERALAAGCDAYVTKPIDTRTFPALVEGWLATARSRVVEGYPGSGSPPSGSNTVRHDQATSRARGPASSSEGDDHQ